MMTLDEKIRIYTQKLSPSLKEELFNYLQYLLKKAEQQEMQEWSSLSLSSALSDMEEEPALYSIDDLQEKFS